MHCEKCGSADTEVTKCGKCGQKSLIRCHNCGNQVCADKYCEVISIKRKIKILTYFAMGLVLLIFLILPVVIMKAMEEPEQPTRPPRPTAVASKPPTAPPKPTTPPASKAPPKSPAQLVQERRDQISAAGRQLASERTPYKKGSSDPMSGGLDFLGYAQHLLKIGGIEVSRSPKELLELGPRLKGTDDLLAGDVLFFTTKPDSKRPNFVGIYLGNGDFGCAFPSGKRQGVLTIALDHPYWAKRYLFGVRTIKSPQ